MPKNRPGLTLIPVGAVLFLLGSGCSVPPERIVLAADPSAAGTLTAGASVVQITPKDRLGLAVLNFENATADSSLDWLCRGLADMVIGDLSQSPTLRVLGPNRIDDILAPVGKVAADLTRDPRAAEAAHAADVNRVLIGTFRKEKGELVIDAEFRDVRTGATLSAESVRGAGLEQVFQMIADLTRRVSRQLREGDLPVSELEPRVSQMTDSIEAYRHYSRGLGFTEQLLHVEAGQEFEQAVTLDPKFAAAYLWLAQVRFSAESAEPSLSALALARENASRLSPTDEVMLRLVSAQLEGDVEGIWAVRDEMLKRAPFDVDLRMRLANLLFGLGDDDRAREELENLIEIDPSRSVAYNQLGYIYARRGDFHTAIKTLEHYRDLTPSEPNANDSIGEVLMMSGRLEDAVEHFRRALERWPGFHNSSMRLSEIYAELGDVEQSLMYADRWAASVPPGAQRRVALGARAATLWRYGRSAEAAAALKLAAAADPRSPSIAFLISALRQDLGDHAGAEQYRSEFCARNADLGTRDGWQRGIALFTVTYCAMGELPGERLLELIDSARARDASAVSRIWFDLNSAKVLLARGDIAKARTYIDKVSGAGLSGWIGGGFSRRSVVWKPLVDLIGGMPTEVPPSRLIAENAIEAARRIGRPALDFQTRLLDLQYHARYGRSLALNETYRDLGLVPPAHWRVIGPYPNRAGFVTAFSPEAGLEVGVRDVASGFEWRVGDDGVHDGYVDLESLFGVASWRVAYAAVDVESPTEQVVQVRLGAASSSKLWVNGDKVWESFASEAKVCGPDQSIIQVVMHRGRNRMLLKVANQLYDWGFYLRVSDEHGHGISDLSFSTPTN